MRNFYPLSILETGRDTIYSWVARMTLVSIYFTGIMPFKEVFCHAMVRDSYGRKMGKSLGNGIDPVDFIEGSTLKALNEKLSQWNLDDQQLAKAKAGQEKEYPDGIPQCGTDALRFTLCAYSGGCTYTFFPTASRRKFLTLFMFLGRDINIEISRVETYRRFCSKIFDATLSFLQGVQEENFTPSLDAKVYSIYLLIACAVAHWTAADGTGNPHRKMDYA
jgi:valyl-tRNA synthetase